MINRTLSYSQVLLIILLPLLIQSIVSNQIENKADQKVLKRVARGFLDRFDPNDPLTNECISTCTTALRAQWKQHKYSMGEAATFCDGYCFSHHQCKVAQSNRLSRLSVKHESTEEQTYTNKEACEIACLSRHKNLPSNERKKFCRLECKYY